MAATTTIPTGVEFLNGVSTIARYLIKLSGSYALPWNINVSGNLTMNDGGTRTISITGPGNVYGGVDANGAADHDLVHHPEFQETNATGSSQSSCWTSASTRTFNFNGGKNRLKLSLDAFNVFNINTITELQQQHVRQLRTSTPRPPSCRRGFSASARRSRSKGGRALALTTRGTALGVVFLRDAGTRGITESAEGSRVASTPRTPASSATAEHRTRTQHPHPAPRTVHCAPCLVIFLRRWPGRKRQRGARAASQTAAPAAPSRGRVVWLLPLFVLVTLAAYPPAWHGGPCGTTMRI